jgi:hypothetical protein
VSVEIPVKKRMIKRNRYVRTCVYYSETIMSTKADTRTTNSEVMCICAFYVTQHSPSIYSDIRE